MPRKRAFKLTPLDPDEDQLQESIKNLLDAILPTDQVAWSHFPAGGYYLTPAARARLFRLGLKKGFPDIIICYERGNTLWLEVKTLKGVIMPDQRLMHMRLRALGHNVVVVRKPQEVISALVKYSVPFRKVRLDGDWYAKNITGEAQIVAEEHAQGDSGIGSSQTEPQKVDWTVEAS